MTHHFCENVQPKASTMLKLEMISAIEGFSLKLAHRFQGQKALCRKADEKRGS